MKTRICFISLALLLSGAALFGAGEYQQTKDGKTMVWNGTPKPGESASWAGSRDSDNYASGFGSLTWYNADGKVYALYYGNMVRGKFDGAVNVHIGGHTAHAYFVDGGRISNWARGPAPSMPPPTVAAVIQKRRAEAEKQKEVETKTQAAKVAAAATPAETPVPKAEAQKPRPAEERVTREAATSPPQETPASIAEQKAPETATTPAQKFEEPESISTPAEQKPDLARSSSTEPSVPAEGENTPPTTERREPSSSSANSESAAASRSTETTRDRDVSLNALVGPPTSLRTTTEPASQSQSSPPEHSGALTESEAIDLANTEARIHGYVLDNYDRPKVDHSNVKGRWSLFYPLKSSADKSSDLAPFTVTVDDKTRKVEIRK